MATASTQVEPPVGVNTRWHVLGAGAMGGLLALRLAESGLSVTLLLRESRGDKLRLQRSGLDGSAEYCFDTQSPFDDSPVSHLLVCTKAYDVCTAVKGMAHRLTAGAQVILLANGMGFAQELAQTLPGLEPVLGTTTEGAFRPSARHIHHAGRGLTRLGRPGQIQAPDWFEPFSRGWACQWDKDINAALWQKLAINSAINALTAIRGCQNGELGRDPVLKAQVRKLCREISPICASQGQHAIARGLESAVFAVIEATADNRSSMLQDIEQGRRTEIHYINGYLLGIARKAGLDAELNATLLEEVIKLEST